MAAVAAVVVMIPIIRIPVPTAHLVAEELEIIQQLPAHLSIVAKDIMAALELPMQQLEMAAAAVVQAVQAEQQPVMHFPE
jgi:hypothetical protein